MSKSKIEWLFGGRVWNPYGIVAGKLDDCSGATHLGHESGAG